MGKTIFIITLSANSGLSYNPTMTTSPTDREILTITQLNRRARQLLETHLPLLWIRGEVSNFSRPGSGHWYLTLKDSEAQIRCAMFRNRNQRVQITPQNGDQVLVRGRVSLYEARGDYQLIIEHMEADGAGLLQQRFDALKNKLQEEGLFDQQYKLNLPEYPQTIAVVTSPTGAALRDILHISGRRYPWVNIHVYPSVVQGDQAAASLACALKLANEHGEADVIILARGGGSLEDLWAFNEEVVARAIFDSKIPVISAVGHETDFTIADFVADYRAPTPSGAAEIAGPDKAVLSRQFNRLCQQLGARMNSLLAHYGHQVVAIRKRLRDPRDRLQQQNQHLDHLRIRLEAAWRKQHTTAVNEVSHWGQRLSAQHSSYRLSQLRERNATLEKRLNRAIAIRVAQKKQDLGAIGGRLHAVSPLSTLERGYSIVKDSQKKIINSVLQVQPKETISITLKDGTVDAVTQQITPKRDHQ